jgi:hypothetical protein
VREAFSKILWLPLSQRPDILRLQIRAYNQLTDKDMPSQGKKTVENAAQQLRKAAVGQAVLCVLGTFLLIVLSLAPSCCFSLCCSCHSFCSSFSVSYCLSFIFCHGVFVLYF